MARSVIKPLADYQASEGLNRPMQDAQQSLRQVQQEIRKPTWQIMTGMVQGSIPGLGWQRVVLEGGNGVVSALAGGRTDDWGIQVDQPTQAGQQVCVAVDRVTSRAVILAHLPPSRVDPRDQFVFSSFVGSWADLSRDAAAAVYMSAEDAGGAVAIENGAMSDVHQGDYAIRTSTGMQFLISTLEMSLTADDVTGLWVNLLDQSVELSGRQVLVVGDGLRLENRLDAATGRFQLGGKLDYYRDPEVRREGSYETWRLTDCDFAYGFDQTPVEVFSYNLWATEQGTIHHGTGHDIQTGADPTVDLRPGSSGSLPQLAFVEYPPAEDDNADWWYPRSNDKESRRQLSERLNRWSDGIDQLHFSQPLVNFVALASGWVASSDQYVKLERQTSELVANPTAPPVSRLDAIRENESVQYGDQRPLDAVFSGKQVEDIRHLASWIYRQPDGSIFIGNESGAGLRLVGDSVFIEGATIRLAAKKDIVAVGRDVQLQGNRDVNLTAQNFVRVASQRNVLIAGGISNYGGVLIESRSTRQLADLPDNAQKSEYAGVVVRSVSSHVLLQGGDVLVHAGARGSGQLIMKSDGGPLRIVTPYQAIIHSAARLDTFGADPTSPTHTHLYAAGLVTLNANLQARSGYFANSLNVSSNIQSYYGRVADSQGGPINRVTPSGQNIFQQTLTQFAGTTADQTARCVENAQDIQARLTVPGGPLNKKFIQELSGGFVSAAKSRKHFGTASLQVTGMSVFQRGWNLPTDSAAGFAMIYKPGVENTGGPTYAWPGDTRGLTLRVPVVDGLERRMAATLTQDPTRLEYTEQVFGEVFSTLKDATDE